MSSQNINQEDVVMAVIAIIIAIIPNVAAMDEVAVFRIRMIILEALPVIILGARPGMKIRAAVLGVVGRKVVIAVALAAVVLTGGTPIVLITNL